MRKAGHSGYDTDSWIIAALTPIPSEYRISLHPHCPSLLIGAEEGPMVPGMTDGTDGARHNLGEGMLRNGVEKRRMVPGMADGARHDLGERLSKKTT